MTRVLNHRFQYWLRRDGLALLIFAIAAAVSIYPVLSAVRWHVIGWPGDNVQYVYMTGWVAEALRTGQFPLLDPHLNYPGQLWLPATDAPFLSMVLVAPFAWLFTPTLAYNVILFASSFASGYFTYLWLYRVTGSRFAGLTAGLSFLFSPYRIVHSYGHLQLISTQFIPLFFWALDQVLQREKSTETHGEARRGDTMNSPCSSVDQKNTYRCLAWLGWCYCACWRDGAVLLGHLRHHRHGVCLVVRTDVAGLGAAGLAMGAGHWGGRAAKRLAVFIDRAGWGLHRLQH